MLKASFAVLIMTPGNWECQCNSLISFCPWWTNSSCAGTSSAEFDVVAASSGSTAKSQIVSRSSAAETASTELSLGFHSSDVIGAVWYRNDTTGVNAELPAWTQYNWQCFYHHSYKLWLPSNAVVTCEIKLFQPSSTMVWNNSAWNYFKIISEACCSWWIFSNMFNAAEIILK